MLLFEASLMQMWLELLFFVEAEGLGLRAEGLELRA